MEYRLDHIAINCRDLNSAVAFYESQLGGKALPQRKGGDGKPFCFIEVSGGTPLQLIESAEAPGLNHYGFVADDMDAVAQDLKTKQAKILREIRNPQGQLTTLFVEDCNGLKMEIRVPR